MAKRYIFYIIFTFFNILLGRESIGVFEVSAYFISDLNVLLFIIIPIIEIFCNKKILVKFLMIIPIIFIVIILFSRKYEREHFIPVNKCSAAYACECTSGEELCKCKYCKERDELDTCIKETYVECEIQQ